MKRIAFQTLGCKSNWADTEEIAAACERGGFIRVPFEELADIYVINTCTVTHVADQQSRQALRRATGRNKSALVLATGCLGEVDKNALAAIVGEGRVFGVSDRKELISFILKNSLSPCGRGLGRGEHIERRGMRARAFLKIQDGCNRRCAYCVVPFARGRPRSMHPDDVINHCKELSRYHHEIVLTGIDISQYGSDFKKRLDIVVLMRTLLKEPGISRLRLTSIAPQVVDKRLIEVLQMKGVCRHIHLSIQSGSDSVLKEMGRPCRSEDIKRAVWLLAGNIKGIAVTGDIIAGFPGETEKAHSETCSLLSSLPLAGLHVFPYSKRPGTRAASNPNQVPHKIKKGRALELRQIGAEARGKFLSNLVGEELEVIVTSKSARGGYVSAFSDNAVSVSVPAGSHEYAGIGRTLITEVSDNEVKGIWVLNQRTKRGSKVLRNVWATNSNAESI